MSDAMESEFSVLCLVFFCQWAELLQLRLGKDTKFYQRDRGRRSILAVILILRLISASVIANGIESREN